jgi:murein DD-endopeptidase MepM/ murein hydrolase activator NlpD
LRRVASRGQSCPPAPQLCTGTRGTALLPRMDQHHRGMVYRLRAGIAAALIALVSTASHACSGPPKAAVTAVPVGPAAPVARPRPVGAKPATVTAEPVVGAQPPPLGAERFLASAKPTTAEVPPESRFYWPLVPVPSVSRSFQPPTQPYGPGHRGADLVGSPGQPVFAAGDGVVVYAGPLADRGVVSVQHANGLRTSYEPLLASVQAGQLVKRGAALGTLTPGHRGCPAPACLHWGLRQDRQYLDPLLLVRRGPVRLLPWPDAADDPAE